MFTRKGILTILALLVFALLHNCAVAGETWLVATVHSYHYDRSADHTENNWGVGIEHHLRSDWTVSGGAYRNSYGDRSVYLGGGWWPIHAQPFHFGLSAGIVNGYKKDPFSGFFIPAMSIQGKDVGVNIGVVPSTSALFTVIGVQLKIRFR